VHLSNVIFIKIIVKKS